MKRKLLTVLAVGAISAAGFTWAQQPDCAAKGPGGWHGHGQSEGGPLGHIAETLNLTPDQKAKVQPILDQAKPQIQAIHQDAMQKMKSVMENTFAQIRPLLTPDQLKKADAMQKAHEDMHNAMKEMHDAQGK